jgi:hypothetical protein
MEAIMGNRNSIMRVDNKIRFVISLNVASYATFLKSPKKLLLSFYAISPLRNVHHNIVINHVGNAGQLAFKPATD